MTVSKKQLHQSYELNFLSQIQELVSLKLLPIPRKWWTLQKHVENCCWLRILVKFRAMNAGLDNRDAYRAADSVSQNGGRVLQCPLCFQGSNNEFHLLMKCNIMIPARSEIKLCDGRLLESTLIDLQSRSQDKFEAARMFLGQDKDLQRTEMMTEDLHSTS